MFFRSVVFVLLLIKFLLAENCNLFTITNKALSSGTVSLTGLWESFPGQITHPDSLPKTAPELRRLPGTWNGSNGQKHLNCATYRCRIVFDTTPPDSLTFACMEQMENYRFYVNGKLVLQDGVPAVRVEEAQPSAIYRSGIYQVGSDTLTCVLQVSAYHYPAEAGPLSPIYLGNPEQMSLRFIRLQIFYAILLGILLILGAQHLISFVSFPGERGYLYFAIYCFIWFILGTIDTNYFRFLTLLVPEFPFEVHYRLYNMFLPLSILITVLFISEIFPSRFLKYLRFPVTLLCSGEAAACVFLPLSLQSALMPKFLFTVLPVLLILFWAVISGIRMKKRGAGVLLSGLTLYSIAAVHDSLVFAGVLSGGYLMLIGVGGFILSQALVLAIRHGDTYRKHKDLLDNLHEANLELTRLSAIKDEFLANTSHELRTPLNGIIGIAESLSADSSIPADRRAVSLNHIMHSGRRLVNLINDILDFSKLRNHDLTIAPRPLCLTAVINDIIPDFIPALNAKGVECKVVIDSDADAVTADPDRLAQIFYNLVGNAVKWTSRGSITIAAKNQGAHIAVTVRDTGIGIQSEMFSKIFEPFEQGSAAPGSGGTGLGLSVTRKLVELHGGKLTVESQPGEGSVFTFTLPAADPDRVLARETLQETPDLQQTHTLLEIGGDTTTSTSANTGKMVLALDDEVTNLLVVQSQLESAGYRVVTRLNGDTILADIKRTAPAIVLLDIMMPGKDGYAVCREIRTRYASAELPVIFLTARNRSVDLVHGFDAGANDYILKPFVRQELLARIGALIAQGELWRVAEENRRLGAQLSALISRRNQLAQEEQVVLEELRHHAEPSVILDESGRIIFANLAFQEQYETDMLLIGSPFQSVIGLKVVFEQLPQKILLDEIDSTKPQVSLTMRAGFWDEREVFFASLISKQEEESLSGWDHLVEKLYRIALRLSDIDTAIGGAVEPQLVSQEDRSLRTVALLRESLDLWSAQTGKSLIKFAEESGIWKVHYDENGWGRARTLEKYLNSTTLPKNPRIGKISATVHYICRVLNDRTAARRLLAVLSVVSPESVDRGNETDLAIRADSKL